MRKLLMVLSGLFIYLPLEAFAQVRVGGGSPSAGDVASNLSEASTFFAGAMAVVFYVIGIALVTASIMQYRDYRNNPVQTPISRPIVLFICGLIIGFMPFMAQYLSSAFSPYSV